MNAPLLPEVLRLREDSAQEALPLATEGVQPRGAREGHEQQVVVREQGADLSNHGDEERERE